MYVKVDWCKTGKSFCREKASHIGNFFSPTTFSLPWNPKEGISSIRPKWKEWESSLQGPCSLPRSNKTTPQSVTCWLKEASPPSIILCSSVSGKGKCFVDSVLLLNEAMLWLWWKKDGERHPKPGAGKDTDATACWWHDRKDQKAIKSLWPLTTTCSAVIGGRQPNCSSGRPETLLGCKRKAGWFVPQTEHKVLNSPKTAHNRNKRLIGKQGFSKELLRGILRRKRRAS